MSLYVKLEKALKECREITEEYCDSILESMNHKNNSIDNYTERKEIGN